MVQVLAIPLRQLLGGQRRTETGVVGRVQCEDRLPVRVRDAVRRGPPAQPMHQTGVAIVLIAPPQPFTLAVGQRQQFRHRHQG